MKKFGIEITYAPGISKKQDDILIRLAKKRGGKLTGSGCMVFGDRERDMTFEFKTKDFANKFFDDVAELRKKQQKKRRAE